ncbi:MSMEG_0565 family glycosyltransferase [Chenggangzhangella methanolivorans]|uniref:MSMEG_0565 family glycosyltransferase n=1 Tax=Chenggangzhangella methanolivorans TaxID=1437009 RepID=A0A9E6R705_9HYPH|nr:MSMEG_0565 family glycosyltransferase [Chenggangzhangella methanolivorans]QZN99395.1 MSMEG_0565 family glycosyltransferase [Chenggangzhangella methanolivorans]
MTRTGSLRIAICCHSVNPRGGVAHALALAEALAGLGHELVVHAPDPAAIGFFRSASVETQAFAAVPAPEGGTSALVEARIGDYAAHFDAARIARFDIFHAQDGLSGNALASLKEAGAIRRFARTVHHVDAFRDPRLIAWQRRAIMRADAHFAVSRLWRRELLAREGVEATVVGNGVDLARYSPEPSGGERALATRLGLGGGPVILAVGGVEERKNTVRLLAAFVQLRRLVPGAQLVVAGGASLLDHGAYRARFRETLAESRLPSDAVVVAGPLPDADMPALYRLADVLAFPSVSEGFGLVALEAMASGTPVVVSSIEPFTEYLSASDVAWCDPLSEGSIANALMAALGGLSEQLSRKGLEAAARHGWERVAKAHLPVYARLAEHAYA